MFFFYLYLRKTRFIEQIKSVSRIGDFLREALLEISRDTHGQTTPRTTVKRGISQND